MTAGRPEKGRLRVLATREEIRPERLTGSTTVVFDVFLATTTLATAFESGARSVQPVASLAEATERAARIDPSRLLLGGEQGARLVEGFDLGPFPEEYPPDRVSGRDVVFLSTNGTVALAQAAAAAPRVLVGTLRNAPALARLLRDDPSGSLHLVCAGSMGRIALEDLAAAAAVIERLDLEDWSLNDGAWLVRDLAARWSGRIPEFVASGRAGRWFTHPERRATFDYVVDIGASEVVPELRAGRLVPAAGSLPSAGVRP